MQYNAVMDTKKEGEKIAAKTRLRRKKYGERYDAKALNIYRV